MVVCVWRLHGDNTCSYYSSAPVLARKKTVVSIDIDHSVFIENLEVVKPYHLERHADNSTTATQ